MNKLKRALRKILTPYLYGTSSAELASSQAYFSQFGEDVCLQFLLKSTDGFYVDIGAFHPMNLSNTYHLYKRGWKGLIVDPNPAVAPLFYRFRSRDVICECAVSNSASDEMDFMLYEKPAFNCLRQFEAAVPEGIRATGKSIKVEVRRLKDIFEEFGIKRIDYLNVDCEGSDLSVLESNDWSRWKPQVLTVEDHSKDWQNSEISSYMISLGYEFVGRTVITSVFSKKMV
ncbi:MAG: FkbM family methyltransferase [Verrucomicrobiota bacterium]